MVNVRGGTIGVGAALRKARERRGLSLHEASRETRMTIEYLRALEDEDFDSLPGEPWVRGSLRTYAHFLGLSREKVAAAYARHADESEPLPPPVVRGPVERSVAATRFSDNHRLLFAAAVTALVVAGVFGLVSRRSDAPPPATPKSDPGQAVSIDNSIEAALVANRDASVAVTVDAAPPATYHLRKGEARSFEATTRLVIWIADGGSVQLTVNGNNEGSPGTRGQSWSHPYSFDASGSFVG